MAVSSAAAGAAVFQWPSNWPVQDAPGVNVSEHDNAHEGATEFWTVQAKFQDSENRKFSAFATFGRFPVDPETNSNGHLVHWSLIEEATEKVWTIPIADTPAVKHLVQAMKSGGYELDARVKDAFLKVFETEKLPLPDIWYKEEADFQKQRLHFRLDQNSISKGPEGDYIVKCADNESKVSFQLILNTGHNNPVRLGKNGFVQQHAAGMFGYAIPGCTVTGNVTLNEQEYSIQGTGTYIRKFSATTTTAAASHEEQKGSDAAAAAAVTAEASPFGREFQWRQLDLTLEDGTQLLVSAAQASAATEHQHVVILSAAGGEVRRLPDVQFVPAALKASSANSRADATSVRTTQYFPSEWTLIADSGRINLSVSMLFHDQEICSWFANPSYWHGRVSAKGLVNGQDTAGEGFLELHPNCPIDSLNTFFARINQLVFAEIDRLMPRNPTYEQVRDLMTTPKYEHFMQGANIEVFRDTIIKPLRDYVDRGFGDEGANWRTFCMLMCMDAVGGNCNRFRNWLSMPELMHVGSLVIDDIEDEAEIRRGGPTTHKSYGTAVALNAGSAAYFMSLFVLQKATPGLSDRTRIKLYEYYMVKMRCGHTGQAFDIEGKDVFLPAVIETGDSGKLEERIGVIHRMKMAVPSGCLARMGALVGGGNSEQLHRIGMYVEAIGVASEIIRSIQSLQKSTAGRRRGYLLKNGKVTLPVAKALGLGKTKEERQALWDLVLQVREEKEGETTAVEKLSAELESLGAFEACRAEARAMVEEHWEKLNSVLPESFSKLMLRSFASFVLDEE